MRNYYFFKGLLTNLFFLLVSSNLLAQTNRPVKYYFSDLYPSFPRKVSIDQDSTGKLYFLPYSHRLLSFDSKKWKSLMKEKGNVSAFKIATSGKIYLGYDNDFGVIERDIKGKPHFKSFANLVGKEHSQISEVWEIETQGANVYFLMKTKMMYWNEDKKELKVIPLSYPGKFFKVKAELYFTDVIEGLYQIKDATFIHKIGEERFTYMHSPIAVMPYENNHLLICNRYGTIYDFDPISLGYRVLNLDFSDKLSGIQIKGGLKLKGGTYLIYSDDAGIFHFDKHGKLIELYQINQGEISHGELKGIFQDREAYVWIATSKGLIKWQAKSNYTIFRKESGLSGIFHDIVNIDSERFMVASSKGLYKGFKSKKGQYVFNKLSDKIGESYALLKTSSGILVGGKHAWVYKDGRLRKIGSHGVNQFSSFLFEGNLYVLGIGNNRIQLFSQKNESWELYKASNFLKHKLTKIHVFRGEYGLDIWVNSEDGALIRIQTSFNGLLSTNPLVLEIAGKSTGLPKGKRRMFASEKELYVAVGDVLYRFDKKKKQFYFYNKRNAYSIENYVNCEGREYFWGRNKKHYFLDYLSTNEIDINWPLDWTGEVRNVKTIANQIALVGHESIVLYDSDVRRTKHLPKIRIDKLISPSDTFYLPVQKNRIKLPYAQNSISFQASLNSFSDNKKYVYKYQLKGFEEKSNRFSLGEKSYSNLPEGRYTLLVSLEGSEGNVLNQQELVILIKAPFYRTIWAYAFYVFLLLLLTYCVFRVYNYRLIRDSKRLARLVGIRTNELEKANGMILEKSKEIRESLSYAAYLQEAILPNQNYFYEHLKDLFILYQPKDEVSGDFYWFMEKDGMKYLAVLDCTGHGVPGAFMSIICKNLLDNILKNSKGCPEVDSVLESLDEGLKRALDQRNKNYIDGLDIGVCRIDNANNELTFSGAHIGLTYVANGELKVIKGNRYAIGDAKYNRKTKTDFVFEKHSLKIDEIDSCYMYTDGFPDQFGGEHGKKFLVKRFRESLLSLQKYPMEDQEYYLNEILENWMEGHAQVDDILVFGFKP